MKPNSPGSIAELCGWYVRDNPEVRGTHRGILRRLQDEPIGSVQAESMTAKDCIDHARFRQAAGVCAATISHDFTYLRGVLDYAKPGWNLPKVSSAAIKEAMPSLRRLRIVGGAARRDQRPTDEQTRCIVEWLHSSGCDPLIAEVVAFQDQSARRVGESCRLLWPDLDEQKKTILVRDLKHPRMKEGFNKRAALPDGAFDIIMRQPRTGERIFPVESKTVSAAYSRACQALGYTGLTLHSSRRGCATRLLEQGVSVPMVMLVTLHNGPTMLLTRYNALKAEDFHARRT